MYPSRYWIERGVTNRLQTFTPRSRFPDQFNPAGNRRIENGGAQNRGTASSRYYEYDLSATSISLSQQGDVSVCKRRKYGGYTMEDA